MCRCSSQSMQFSFIILMKNKLMILLVDSAWPLPCRLYMSRSYVVIGCDNNQMNQTWQSTKGLSYFCHNGIIFHLVAWQMLVGLFQTQARWSPSMFFAWKPKPVVYRFFLDTFRLKPKTCALWFLGFNAQTCFHSLCFFCNFSFLHWNGGQGDRNTLTF
jgi:hypothetical protein